MLSELSGQTLKTNYSNALDPPKADLNQQQKVYCGSPCPVLLAFHSARQPFMRQSVLYSPGNPPAKKTLSALNLSVGGSNSSSVKVRGTQ